MQDWRKTTGAKLYNKAKKIIPGGTQLLSKRPEMFLPELWPSYYSKAKGCEVWDLDGRHFIDMSYCGIGACLLGFADEDVNEAVKNCIDNGSMSTLNTPVEVELAELLCEIHPWADMVRYARTGGESMSIAVRIARAHTKRDKIAICGYHGWSDWYLAANLSTDKALKDHLIPGLQPQGVPQGLQGTTLPFHYNNIEELEIICKENANEIAAVVMEPMRSDLPENGFLQKVKNITKEMGAVLIFDEISSGWRHHFGGVHLDFGIEPDIAVFAKSMSNGFPMAALTGTRKVMQSAQDSFISSTYWTEAVGPSAALATIRKMQKYNVSEHIKKIGNIVQKGWRNLADKYDCDISIAGQPALCSFSFNHKQAQELRTLLTQCMLDEGFLAIPTFYPTFAHTEEIIEQYLAALDNTFAIMRDAVDQKNIMNRLKGPVAHKGFARLT
jgi:glutamate-1-semialdehyde 2,1-aminomutase